MDHSKLRRMKKGREGGAYEKEVVTKRRYQEKRKETLYGK